MPLLEVKNLKVQFRTPEGVVRAVDGISLAIDAGKTVCLVGESGCGKSVTSLSILGLLRSPPAEIPAGEILLEGKNLLSLKSSQLRSIRGKEISMIFQEPMTSLNPVYTIGFQIGEALRAHDSSISNLDLRKKIQELLSHVGIAEPERRMDDYPHHLSGGMRQRAMIAMALACHPKLLVADEPTTALDVTIQAQILELMQRLQKEHGMSILLITHDLGIVAEVADDVIIMYAGKIVESASVLELFKNPMHPYTQGLLASIPSTQHLGEVVAGKKISRLRAIAGNVPSLKKLPVGCRFQDRCPWKVDRCEKSEPVLEALKPGHMVACFEAEKSQR